MTTHKRGEAIEGYKRLYLAFCNNYDEPIPAKLLVITVKNYLPELFKQCPEITEELIDFYFEDKNKQ